MIDLIQQRRAEIDLLCRSYSVRALELFGSAAEGTFDPARSDLDFVVDFLPLQPGQLFDFFFDLKHDLEGLFGRKIDLVTTRAIQGSDFARMVKNSRQVLYAA